MLVNFIYFRRRNDEREREKKKEREKEEKKEVKVERKRSGSQNNSRDSTASQHGQRRRSGSRPSSLKDKEAIFNAVFNAPRPEEEVATDHGENRDDCFSHV